MEPSIALLGFGVGVLVGLTGMGGAALMTPLLILLVGMRPLVAVGTDLAYSTVTKMVGGWQHARQNNVDLPIVRFLALGSVPGGLLGVGLLGVVQGLYGEGIDAFVRRMLGLVLVVVALVVLVRPLFFRGSGRVAQQSFQLTSRRKALTTLLGAVVGFLVGITSVGSGTLIIAGLTLFYRLPLSRIVGTDVLHAALLVSATALAHWGLGSVDVLLALNLLIGSVPGVLLGSRLSLWVPEASLRPLVVVVLMASGLKLI